MGRLNLNNLSTQTGVELINITHRAGEPGLYDFDLEGKWDPDWDLTFGLRLSTQNFIYI